MGIKFIILAIRAIPKSIYFNFKYLKLRDAIKFPFIISHRVSLSCLKGNIIIDSPIKTGMIRIGFGKVKIFDQQKMRVVWHVEKGTVTFKGGAHIGNGTCIFSSGDLTFGNNFVISAHTKIACYKKIVFGDDNVIGWDCLFMDSDAHQIINKDNERINNDKEIIIGDRVWIGAKCTILKGVTTGNDVVIAANSCLIKSLYINECILGGSPIRVLKENTRFILDYPH